MSKLIYVCTSLVVSLFCETVDQFVSCLIHFLWLAIFVSLTHYCGILWSTELVLWHPLKDSQHSWPKLASHPDTGGTQLLGLYNKRITKVHWIIERLTQNPGATTLTLSQCLCWEKGKRRPTTINHTKKLYTFVSLWINFLCKYI